MSYGGILVCTAEEQGGGTHERRTGKYSIDRRRVIEAVADDDDVGPLLGGAHERDGRAVRGDRLEPGLAESMDERPDARRIGIHDEGA